ncbi:hypothetical protein OIU77_023832 [Salix suchowensis]|uniref:Uncharacterized protein n=1 Tax=Salix suchowensis TaxID=1278906 RepID=A0ABQ9C897_9ROSI|nr:hypothetical protein OIU77_023832 [Salix suchowensis]
MDGLVGRIIRCKATPSTDLLNCSFPCLLVHENEEKGHGPRGRSFKQNSHHPLPVQSAPVSEKIMPSPIISEAVKLIEPVREDQQRELFKWILEEKRKVKPKDSEERKRIDDEKAILKQFIRAKSIPGI